MKNTDLNVSAHDLHAHPMPFVMIIIGRVHQGSHFIYNKNFIGERFSFRPLPSRSRLPPFYRGGRPPFTSRIASRGRIFYHDRPDISPPRVRRSRSKSRNRESPQQSARNHSPNRHRSRSRSAQFRGHNRRSLSPPWPRGRGRGRGGFFRAGRPRASRGSIIGNFGIEFRNKKYNFSFRLSNKLQARL